ncbi:MAG: putative ABC transporter permease, partial [Propioniciclava sp.]
LGIWFLLVYLGALGQGELAGRQVLVGAIYLAATFLALAGAIVLMVMERHADTLPRARLVARAVMVALVVSISFSLFAFGLRWLLLIHLYQVAWLVHFQLATDPALNRSQQFHSPWQPTDGEKRRGYIPLNFFNLFWVYVVASVVGLLVEVLWHALTVGGYQDRAGLLWGPFSPIYGFGAVLMTIALNRFWNRSKLVIFVVAGAIGAAFEFMVSFLMETAFGIVAWDYSGTFLNIGGRTNVAFACAWGFLGLVWIKLLLPDVLRIVDAIPLRWRTVVTTVAAVLMLVDQIVTVVALDCWYQREAGQPPTGIVQQYCAEHFDDDFMQNRFQTMTMDPENAGRVRG